jgi:cyclohexanecarboxyl-CoA dehydrogenase
MDLSFTPEQEAFAKSVREWARTELAPAYLSRATQAAFPRDIYKQLGDMGLLAILTPEEDGGQGGDHVTAGIAAEEIGYADFSCGFLVLAAAIGWEIIWRLGSDEAKDWGARAIAGDVVLAAALTEPGAGSDLANVTTRATKTLTGWSISGEKSSISLAGAADAALVLARTDERTGAQGTGLFLVPLDGSKIARQTFEDPGFRPVGRGSISFDGVEVPDSLHLDTNGRGFHTIMQVFDFSRAYLGLMCIGSAQASMDEAAEYARVRHTFGRPIGRHQGVAFPLAEHDTYLRAARFICYEALWRRDRGLPHTREAAAAKWFAPKVAFEAAHEALLLHGNVGYTSEAPFAQRLLDIMSCEIGDGTAQIQKAVIARELLGREFKSY